MSIEAETRTRSWSPVFLEPVPSTNGHVLYFNGAMATILDPALREDSKEIPSVPAIQEEGREERLKQFMNRHRKLHRAAQIVTAAAITTGLYFAMPDLYHSLTYSINANTQTIGPGEDPPPTSPKQFFELVRTGGLLFDGEDFIGIYPTPPSELNNTDMISKYNIRALLGLPPVDKPIRHYSHLSSHHRPVRKP